MVDRTDRHFQALMACIAPSVRVYAEMVVASGDRRRLRRTELGGVGVRQYVAAQLAGDEPRVMAEAAAEAEVRGFDEVNINCGCPSQAAVAGGYGAVLMRTPDRIADLVAAIVARVSLPVSVKCRLSVVPGQEDVAQLQRLCDLLTRVQAAGCNHVIVHARAADLTRSSTRDNRRIPSLRHDLVCALAEARRTLRIEVNGGIGSLADGRARCRGSRIAGVMIGRAAYDDPLLFAGLDRQHVDRAVLLPEVIDAMARYVDAQRRDGVAAWSIVRHMLGVSRGLPGGKRVRARLAALSQMPDPDGRAVVAALNVGLASVQSSRSAH